MFARIGACVECLLLQALQCTRSNVDNAHGLRRDALGNDQATVESDKGVLRCCKNSDGRLSEWNALGGEPTPCPDPGVFSLRVLEKDDITQDERAYDRGMGGTDDFIESRRVPRASSRTDDPAIARCQTSV